MQIGQTTNPIDETEELQRSEETAIGDFAADTVRSYTYSDVAIINGGGIRADRIIPAGVLTKKDIMDSFPFTNYVVKLEVTGDQLYQALENGVSQTEKVAGRFPQVSGIQYSYNPYLPAGSRIISVTVDGKPLDKTAKYTLATLDFVAGGGDGYSMLKKAKVLLDANGGPLLSKLIIDTIQKDQSISPQTDGRIKVEEELPQDAFVDIKGNSVPAILELKQKGIVHGIDDTHFNPDGFVTRAEFTAMLVAAMQLPQDSSTPIPFADITASDWYASFAAAANKAGIISGDSNGMFHGNDKISLADIQSILSKALMNKFGKTDSFADIMKSISSNVTNPTRADAAIMIQQFIHAN
jgi:2',3'-cyclic-nucleotide 2'-phosphodiesterase/3'-nucleotidase